MIELRQWLEQRLTDVPPSLSERIRAALSRHPGDLRAAGAALLEDAKQGDGRDTALTLLAADALVTYACEWTAEHAPERLGELR